MRLPWSTPPKETPSTEALVGALSRRVDDVELELGHVLDQMRKIRGRLTGALRNAAPDQDAEPASPASPAPSRVAELLAKHRSNRRY